MTLSKRVQEQETLPFRYIAEGHVLIWAGMLLRPV